MKKNLLSLLFFLSFYFSFSQENLNDNIKLFPNTASTRINLVLPTDTAPIDISIFDLTGRLMREIPVNNTNIYNIDVGWLTQGVYLIAISTDTGTQVKKFIVDPLSTNYYSNYSGSNEETLKKVAVSANINTISKSIKPLDDAYLQGNTRYNTAIMKVYTSWRSSYFKFDLHSVQGKITSAKLKFTIDSDEGSGLIQVYKGSSTNWTEVTLSSSNKPQKSGGPIGTTSGTHSMGKRVSIDLDVNKLETSLLSLIMVQPNGTNDFAFASKEHGSIAAPELLVTYESSNTSNNPDTSDDNKSEEEEEEEDYTTTGNNIPPLDDAFLQGSSRSNTATLKVYTNYRSSYLKFDLSAVPPNFTGAELNFTIDADAGSGEIQVYKGNSTNWTEENLSSSNKPGKSGSPIGTKNGTYAIGKRISIDLDASKLDNSLVSLIMVQPDGTNDFAFASKEHPTKAPPELVFTYGSADKSPTEGNPAEFELYFHDMQVLLDMQDALSFYSNAKRQEWLEKQEEVFKNEINHLLGTEHSSFSNAKRDFFKNYEKNFLKVESRAYDIAASHTKKSQSLNKEQEVFTEELFYLEEWKLKGDYCIFSDGIIFGGFPQPASHECQNLFNTVVRGKTLKSLGSAQLLDGTPGTKFSELRNKVLIDFSEREYESAQNKSWASGIYNIINDGNLLNTLSNKHINYYDKQGLEDKVFLMTSYLVQYYNRNLGVLQQPIPKYNIPPFWSNETLLEMGKEKAPALDAEEKVFSPKYISTVLANCANGNQRPNGQQGPDNRDCAKVKQDLLDLKEQVIDEHLTEFTTSEYLLTEMVLSEDVPWDITKKGFYNNHESLKYNATRNIKIAGRLLKEFRLENGDRLVNGIYPIAPYSNEGEEVTFYYSRTANEWYQYDVPPISYKETDLDYFINKFWSGPAQFVGRYIIPVEDIIILIDGKDFNGVESNRLQAGGFLILEVIPGSKLLRPVKKVVTNAKEWIFIYKSGNKIYTKVVREISDTTKRTFDEFSSLFNAGEAVKRLLYDGKYADNIINEVAEELPQISKVKNRKLTWPEILKLFERGNNFDKLGRLGLGRFNEIVLANGKRLDSYIPGKAIISRKATDVDNILEATWRKYCNELITKYKIGTKLNSRKLTNFPPLSGQYFLEIPLSNKNAAKMKEYIEIAKEYGIEIIFLAE
ncbi:T9SS C-terminal target domain-containing protein [Zobellia amurskyensis]|uniref:T9SS C-terminal target domain-containing protein n=1 Tax=Zobellia amurskyensis TaxID=248905 RepID=A0A7X2ZU08_9FLAO|nr:DNRLRE domain-containing protein [Zobellia amurskyensis]MUH36387.1 T9SS C-terminal target domain-containing protein [Zobellia amurskyensis]